MSRDAELALSIIKKITECDGAFWLEELDSGKTGVDSGWIDVTPDEADLIERLTRP